MATNRAVVRISKVVSSTLFNTAHVHRNWVETNAQNVFLHVLCQTVSKSRDSSVRWTCGKRSHIFSSATFNSETVLSFGLEGFKNSFACHSSDISPRHSNSVLAVVPFQSLGGSSRGGITATRAMLTELLVQSEARLRQLHSSIKKSAQRDAKPARWL